MDKFAKQVFGLDVPAELIESLEKLAKLFENSKEQQKFEQLQEKLQKQIHCQLESLQSDGDDDFHPLSAEMHERIAALETQVKLLREKKQQTANLLVQLIGRYKILREDNSFLTSSLIELKTNNLQNGGGFTPTKFSSSLPSLAESDVPITPYPSFASTASSSFPNHRIKDSMNRQLRNHFCSNKSFEQSEELLQRLHSLSSSQGSPLTPHPSFASAAETVNSNERMLDDLRSQVQRLKIAQQEQQQVILQEQKKLEAEEKLYAAMKEAHRKENEQDADEEEEEEEEEDEETDFEDMDEDEQILETKAEDLPSLFLGDYRAEELQLYEEALNESRSLIIELESQLVESKREEEQLAQVRKNVELALQETQSQNVEVEEQLIAAENKLKREQDRAAQLQAELDALVSDHSLARKHLQEEIHTLRMELGKQLQKSLQDGIDLEFEEFVDIAEYIQDEDEPDAPIPINPTVTSGGRKTKIFSKLISYWQTRSTGSFKKVKPSKSQKENTQRKSLEDTTSQQPQPVPSTQGSTSSVMSSQTEVMSKMTQSNGNVEQQQKDETNKDNPKL
eukprot:TRINITY_DN535_c0_g2_i1.p1 TRINITY_DN535_c0_g2~~TRINITY_DN535_c0_g2_i1.p1  ORF type:complete len:565 (+),score=115.63 TRINITY_DN535_c0_g2_i1:222-1916(+)